MVGERCVGDFCHRIEQELWKITSQELMFLEGLGLKLAVKVEDEGEVICPYTRLLQCQHPAYTMLSVRLRTPPCVTLQKEIQLQAAMHLSCQA